MSELGRKGDNRCSYKDTHRPCRAGTSLSFPSHPRCYLTIERIQTELHEGNESHPTVALQRKKGTEQRVEKKLI